MAKLPKTPRLSPTVLTAGIIVLAALAYAGVVTYRLIASQRLAMEQSQNLAAQTAELTSLKDKITELETEDQRAKNKALADLIAQLKDSYKKSVSVYESLVDLKIASKNTAKLDAAYAAAVSLLVAEDYVQGNTKLDQLSKDILAESQKVPAGSSALSAPASNTPPSSGYSRQTVKSDIGDYVVSLVSGDLGSTKVIVDTASDGDCGNECPVMSLASYAARSGAYAGVNGTYFCPAAYPTCAGKTNSFDLLVMNKNKTYFNSGNNVYSNNPAVIFGGGYIRFVSSVSQWGRDTGVDGVLSNYPITVSGGNISFGGNDDPKQGSRGNRSFVANRGNTVYIGVVHNVTVAESAHVLKSLGMENALNLDSGGSTALWAGGYKVGPGRDIPNAILFVKK